MIKAIADLVGAALAAKGCPLPVIYGPEPTVTTAIVRPRIVFERDRKSGDAINSPRSQHRLPRSVGVRAIGATARVFAQSTNDGANIWDHERMADAAVDMIHVALQSICASRRMPLAVRSAKFLTPEELQMRGLQVHHGVVYELQFTVDRGVLDRTWAGEGPDTTTAPAVTSTTLAKFFGSDANPETGCGG